MAMLLLLSLSLLAMSAVSAQSVNDATTLNSIECGLSPGSKRLGKRFLSSSLANNQNEWGWHVLLLDDKQQARSGSLINSQWVVTNAFLAKYEL
jgi:hypothetical protein